MDRREMVWKELSYCLARLVPRLSIGRSWEGRQMGKCSLLISNYFTTASSHQHNMGSGYRLAEMYSGAFLALDVFSTHQRIYSLIGHYRRRAGKGSSAQKGN